VLPVLPLVEVGAAAAVAGEAPASRKPAGMSLPMA
jgi:hypothetical protein